jgi:hypothetical protein
MEKEKNKIQKPGTGNDSAENKIEQENSIKITIARDSADGLAELVQRLNDGFTAGRVHRQDLASWIITKFLRNHTEADLQSIREAHYDDASMLENMYRKVRETGEMPEFLRDAMRKHFKGQAEVPKKQKKSLTSEFINDVHLNNEDAE